MLCAKTSSLRILLSSWLKRINAANYGSDFSLAFISATKNVTAHADGRLSRYIRLGYWLAAAIWAMRSKLSENAVLYPCTYRRAVSSHCASHCGYQNAMTQYSPPHEQQTTCHRFATLQLRDWDCCRISPAEDCGVCVL